MNRYSDLFYQSKSNNKRIENIDKSREEYTFYKNDSFSIRMIVVMLILAAVMFLKQTGVFSENAAYESVMAEIHRQIAVEEIESMIKEEAVYPVMNWVNRK